MEADEQVQTDKSISDRDLMHLVARENQEAFDLLYLRYKASLLRFIAGFIADETTAEDLLQETFLRVYQNAARYDQTHKFSSWLYRIATNLCLNELRRRKAHPLLSLNQQVRMGLTDSESETVELHELIPDSCSVGPTEAVESSETMEEISSALDALTRAHREVITMHLYDEMKYEQIAQVLKCSIGTVKSRAFYGIRALRDKLESEKELQ